MASKDGADDCRQMEAVGRLAMGLAHEINNKLGPILIYAQIALSGRLEGKLRQQMEVIEANTLAIKEIIETLANLARPGPQARTRFSVNGALRNAVKMLKYRFDGQGVAHEFRFAESLPPAWAVRGQIELVFFYILNSALDGMCGESNRRILVETAREGTAVVVRLCALASGGNPAPGERVPRPPEPDTRAGRQGAASRRKVEAEGGEAAVFAAVRQILRAHGGRMDVLPLAEEGTDFRLTLPILSPGQEAEALGPRTLPGGAAGLHGRILLVDGDPASAGAIRDALAVEAGLDLTGAGDSREACRLLEASIFDAVLCGLPLPRRGGPELQQSLRRLEQETSGRLIFFTGDILAARGEPLLRETGAPCLLRPFPLEELRRLLASRLVPGAPERT